VSVQPAAARRDRRPPSRHLPGDLGRVLRESLRFVHGPVVLVTVTQPGEFDNLTAAKRWRALNGRLRVELDRRYGLHPPRIVARVAQRQRRGADHLHCVYLARTPDQRERVRAWVEAYREFASVYGLGFVDDPFRLRRGRDGQMRDMVFEQPEIAGAYLGRYLAGGQLERFLSASDTSWRVFWVSPELLKASGWSLERCRWVRQGWHVAAGTWRGSAGPFGGLVTRLPSWWFRPDDRDWVMSVIGSSASSVGNVRGGTGGPAAGADGDGREAGAPAGGRGPAPKRTERRRRREAIAAGRSGRTAS